MGHIMRCLVLAQQYNEVLFAVRSLPGALDLQHPHHVLKTDHIDELIELIHHEKPDLLVIDHYDIDENDERRIKQRTHVKILSLDDTYRRHHCDILLNHNIYAESSRYIDLVPSDCEIRCGSKYTLLRQEFYDAKKAHKDKKSPQAFIVMGGTDIANLNGKILKALPDWRVKVITTTANPYLEELRQQVSEHQSAELIINAQNIASIISESTFGVLTPSVIANEAYFLGVPFVAIQTAENQRYMYDYLEECGYLVMKHFDENRLREWSGCLINIHL